jgi:hypothetical protein
MLPQLKKTNAIQWRMFQQVVLRQASLMEALVVAILQQARFRTSQQTRPSLSLLITKVKECFAVTLQIYLLAEA